jgi:hypothetical protein
MLALGAPLGMIWTVINVVSLLAGVQLICLGFVCAYLARMYFEIKARPIFITREESIEEKETPNE